LGGRRQRRCDRGFSIAHCGYRRARPTRRTLTGTDVYALEDRCTHDGEPLDGAEIDSCQIICPRHGAHFCARTERGPQRLRRMNRYGRQGEDREPAGSWWRTRVKRLTLIATRNAQWKDPQISDFDRPLNRRGTSEAEAMSRRLHRVEADSDNCADEFRPPGPTDCGTLWRGSWEFGQKLAHRRGVVPAPAADILRVIHTTGRAFRTC